MKKIIRNSIIIIVIILLASVILGYCYIKEYIDEGLLIFIATISGGLMTMLGVVFALVDSTNERRMENSPLIDLSCADIDTLNQKSYIYFGGLFEQNHRRINLKISNKGRSEVEIKAVIIGKLNPKEKNLYRTIYTKYYVTKLENKSYDKQPGMMNENICVGGSAKIPVGVSINTYTKDKKYEMIGADNYIRYFVEIWYSNKHVKKKRILKNEYLVSYLLLDESPENDDEVFKSIDVSYMTTKEHKIREFNSIIKEAENNKRSDGNYDPFLINDSI